MPVAGEPLLDDASADPTHKTRWSYTSSTDLPLPDEDPTQPFCPRHVTTIARLNRSSFGPYPVGVDSTTPHRDWHSGNLDYILSHRSWCRVCGLIADVINNDPANSMLERNNAEIIACWVWDGVLSKSSGEMGTLRLRIAPEMVGWEDLFEPFDLVPLADSGINDCLFLGRKIEEDQFDLELVKVWARSCAEWHGDECLDTTPWQTSHLGVPFIRMISLADYKLIETSCPPPYAALSYVWGSSPVFQTLQSNVKDLMQPQGLPVPSLPRSIRDAMVLARDLGFEYIWIDSICIIQDSAEDKIQQLRMMDSIYSRASLTIVAAAGAHANAGIPGLQPASRSRKQHIVQISKDLTLAALNPDTHRSATATTWNTRGWTYQERLLSKRCVFSFPNGSVSFQCSKAVWGEDYYAETRDLKRCAPMMDISLNRSWMAPGYANERGAPTVHITNTPYLHEYCRLVEEYTGRNMSYPSDRLAGINGVLDVFRREFGLQFLHGLPEVLIHMALLWQPHNKLKRVPKDPKTGLPFFPSWSWTGWTGSVGYENWDAFNGMLELEDRAKRPEEIKTFGQPRWLSLRTRVARFRLTNLVLSSDFNKEDFPIEKRGRFGLSLPSPSAGDRPWLGTILLPVQYHAKMAQDHEFIVLSESYGFNRQEMAPAAAIKTEPFEVYDVMMIRRITSDELAQYRSQLAAESAHMDKWFDGKSIVERIGVGRMVKSAWNGDDHWDDFVLV
ncbi:heterokaryon incompatibility domain-containing protein [Trichoderma velutinum]